MDNSQTRQVSLLQGLAYASPLFCSAFLVVPATSVLLGIYAKYFGLTLATISMVVLIARIFDVITDPLIGHLSDRYRVRKGTRKPFVFIGCVGLIISSYFLFMPPKEVSTGYFLVWFLAFYLAATLIEIPHIAWGSELVSDYQEKNKIFSLRSSFIYAGVTIFSCIPFLPLFDTTEFTPETLKWTVLVIAIIMVPSLYACISKAPNGVVVAQKEKESIRLLCTSLISNRPLLIVLGAVFLIAIGFGMFIGLVFSVADSYLGLGDKLPLLALLTNAIALAFLPVWYRLANYLAKKLVFGLGVLLIGIGLLGLQMLQPGESAFLQFLVLNTLQNIGWVSVGVFGPSLLSDTVGYGIWKFGTDHSGFYFAFYSLLNKAGLGLGAALGLAVAGWHGFDPTVQVHGEESLRGMYLAISYIPTLLVLVAGMLVIMIPINARRYRIIQQRLASRIQRNSESLPKSNPNESAMNSTTQTPTPAT